MIDAFVPRPSPAEVATIRAAAAAHKLARRLWHSMPSRYPSPSEERTAAAFGVPPCFVKLMVRLAIGGIDRLEPPSWSPALTWPDFVAVGTLHVGFVTVNETPEHVERLRNESSHLPDPRPCRSKLRRSTLATVHPIDRVACRVAHPES